MQQMPFQNSNPQILLVSRQLYLGDMFIYLSLSFIRNCAWGRQILPKHIQDYLTMVQK
jgi:hypothetical protein